MFYQIPLTGTDEVITLLQRGYTELESCIYDEKEKKSLVICVNNIKKNFFITDAEGIKDTEKLVKDKYKKKIIKTTIEKITL